jgi:ankyrin repeat protein
MPSDAKTDATPFAALSEAARSSAPLRAMATLSLSAARRLALRFRATKKERPEFDQFFAAILAGDAAETARLAPWFSPTRRDVWGGTALMNAASVGQLECVKALLPHSLPQLAWKRQGHGIDSLIISTSSDGDTALMLAVRTGRLDVVRELARQPGATATRPQDGFGALMLASSLPFPEIVRELAASLGDLERAAKGVKGRTALAVAAEAAQEDNVEALLSAGARVFAPKDAKESPVSAAASGFELPAGNAGVSFIGMLLSDLRAAHGGSAQPEGRDPLAQAAHERRARVFLRLWSALNDDQKRIEASRDLRSAERARAPLLTLLAHSGEVALIDAVAPFCPPSDRLSDSDNLFADPLHSALLAAARTGKTAVAVRLLELGAAPLKEGESRASGGVLRAAFSLSARPAAKEEHVRAIAQALPDEALRACASGLDELPGWLAAMVESRELHATLAGVSPPSVVAAALAGATGDHASAAAPTRPVRRARAL